MTQKRKLGKPTDQRIALLKNQVTALFQHGEIKTTLTRAKEVKNIAEKLLTLAIKDCDDFQTKEVRVTKAKLDSSGKKVLDTVKSKNGKEYDVVDREETTEMRTVDGAKRLHARKQIINWVYDVKDQDGNRVKVVNKILDDIAPRYKDVQGGYTRIYRLEQRRGDAAPMALLQLVDVNSDK